MNELLKQENKRSRNGFTRRLRVCVYVSARIKREHKTALLIKINDRQMHRRTWYDVEKINI